MFNVVEDPHADTKREKLWKLMETYLPSDVHSIQRSVVNHVVRALFSVPKPNAFPERGIAILDGLQIYDSTRDMM